MSQRPDDEMVPHPARRRVRVVSLAVAAGMISRAESALSSKGWAGPAHLPYNKVCTRIATHGLPLSFCSSMPVLQQVETAAAAADGGATQAFARELTMPFKSHCSPDKWCGLRCLDVPALAHWG